LRDAGYTLEIRAGFLLINDVPYVNAARKVLRGMLVCKLDLANDVAVKPEDHTTYFAGEYPCRDDGSPIEQIRNETATKVLAEGITVNHRFSAKPQPSGAYADFYEKVRAYVAILQGPAHLIDPTAKAEVFRPVAGDADEGSVFNYIDTASSRAEIGLVTDKLKKIRKVAIVGLGGTGAYVLDLVAKTPVGEIHLFDGDEFLQHNAFRTPGAPPLNVLDAKPHKVSYLCEIYDNMRRGIVAHNVYLGAENADLLRDIDFVFLCLDRGSARRVIVEKLETLKIPFVDVGMGVYDADGSLGGTLRVTTSTPDNREGARANIPFSDGNEQNEYARNIQIADLNMLNAALAVIKWKKLFGFYLDSAGERHSTYTIELQLLTKEDRLNDV
jgi:hypothetical protein